MERNLAGAEEAKRNLKPRKVWAQTARTLLEMMWMTGRYTPTCAAVPQDGERRTSWPTRWPRGAVCCS